MPKIEDYTDYRTVLKYESVPYPILPYNTKDIIIKTKEEFDELLLDFQMEIMDDARDKYDDAFFEENALILTRMITRSSGSIKLSVNNLYVSGNKVYVVIRTDVPVDGGTCNMQYACFAFAVDKDDVVNVNEVITLE